MVIWHFLIVAGLVFLIIEIFTPMLFFLNFALASFLTAIVAVFVKDINVLVPVFVVLSALFLIFLRPFLVKRMQHDGKQTGIEGKYIGKSAKVIEIVNSQSGAVSIYDERWNARSINGEEIPVGEMVNIVKNDSLVLYVEKM